MANVEDFDSSTGLSANAVKKPQLRLPLSCEPPGPNNPPKQRVWIVFGGTGHMGRSVVKTALAKGDIVTMVGRSQMDDLANMRRAFSSSTSTNFPNPSQKLRGAVSSASKTKSVRKRGNRPSSPASSLPSTENESHPNLLCLLCDVRVRSSVAGALAAHIEHWEARCGDSGADEARGRLDIVANCSGFGVFGSCEDQDDAELRNQFETNFWGTLHIVQLSLPHLRANGGGRYLIFSSTSGALGVPGLGPYCATKYAVEGLVESMLYEIDAFDIRATLVSPGHVRRDEPEDIEAEKSRSEKSDDEARASSQAGGSGLGQLPVYSSFMIKPPSAPYRTATSPALHAKRVVQWMADSQPTSVVKAAELVWQLAHCSYPPLRLLLGSFAVDSVRDRLRTIMEEIEDWKFLSFGEDVDPDKARERISGKEPSRENSDDDDDMMATLQASLLQDQHGDLMDDNLSDLDDGEDDYAMEDG